MKKLFFIVVPIFIFVVACYALFQIYLNAPLRHQNATMVVSKGTPMVMISAQLGNAGVIKYPILFSIYARLSHADRKMKAGEYEFPDGMTPIEVLNKLKKGDVKLYKITLIEGWTAAQMADYLSKQPFLSPSFGKIFLDSVNDRFYLISLGLNANNAEGYLFPDTYMIQRISTPDDLVALLVKTFANHYNAELENRTRELGMTREQVVTLASVIEKETGVESERPLVASVFYNRLKQGIPLQTDPTVIYGIEQKRNGGFNGNLTKRDLQEQNPYNTYLNKGLPPGPISNPSLASIKAALWPATSDYLYFVSKGDGSHQFSANLADHNRAVAKYQLRK